MAVYNVSAPEVQQKMYNVQTVRKSVPVHCAYIVVYNIHSNI